MPDILPDDVSTTEGGGSALVTVPTDAPEIKPEKKPVWRPEIQNYAENEDTVKKVLAWVKGYKSTFEGQSAREEFEDEMDVADELSRAAANRTQLTSDESDNTEDTRSKVKSATLYADLRSITANETSIMLGNEEEIPAKFEPATISNDEQAEDLQKKADRSNALLAYTVNMSRQRPRFGEQLWKLNKYGNQVVEIKWNRRKTNTIERVPVVKVDPITGKEKITSWKFQKKEIISVDWPETITHDMKDVWFDAMIDGIQDQSCVIIRRQMQLSDIWNLQKSGEFLNAEKISKDQLYGGEGDSEVKGDRQDNAGEQDDSDSPTSLFDVYRGWIRVPINDEEGEWDEKKELCHWYEFYFVGDLSTKPICIRLSPNYYFPDAGTPVYGEIPLLLWHCIKDDKGAFHVSYSQLVKSLLAQEMTSTDQAVDNTTLRNQAPWIMEKGAITLRDMTFTAGGNKVFIKNRAAPDPKIIEVPDTTRFTMNMLGLINDNRQRVLGTNKAFTGEEMTPRVSASGFIGTTEQALKPALEDAKYKAEQYWPWFMYWVRKMWNQFGDPDRIINITYEGVQQFFSVSDTYGDMNIKLTCIKRFQDNILRRKEDDQIMAQIVPVMAQTGVSDASGLKVLFSQYLKNRGVQNVEQIIKTGVDYDARHVARSENVAVLWNGIYDMPKPEENHKAHLDEHKPYFGTVSLLPEGDAPAERNLNMMRLHIKMHEDMEKQKQLPAMTGAVPGQQEAPQESPPTLPGELAGDIMGGEMGETANLGAAETGRPPDYQGEEMGNIQ